MIAFIATFISIVNSPSLSQISWFPVALLLLGSGMLVFAINRYILFRKQFSLRITRNTLCDDGHLEGHIAIRNATWQWKAESRIYLKLKELDENGDELLIDVDSRLRPKGRHIHIDFSTVINKCFFGRSIALNEPFSGKLCVEFIYNDDVFKESFTIAEKPR